MKNSSRVFYRSLKVYMRAFGTIVVLLLMIAICCILFYDSYLKNTPVSDKFLEKWIGMLVLASIFLFICVGLVIKELKSFFFNTKPIAISEIGISIGDELFSWQRVKEIRTISLINFNYLYYHGATIVLENDDSRFILGEGYYRNDALLLSTLDGINNKCINSDGDEAVASNVLHENEYYKFNLFTSIDHILFSFIFLIAISGIIKYIDSIGLCSMFLAVFCIFYYISANVSYCFTITASTIQVENKMLFGYSKIYNISDIKGIVIYRKSFGRSSQYGMRIVLKDSTSFFYASNPLSIKKWKAMGDSFIRRGIYVVNQWND